MNAISPRRGRPRKHQPEKATTQDFSREVEFERLHIRNRILTTGVALRSDVEDRIVSASELATDGWEREPDTDNWRRPRG
jgi:hypothetical protein